MISTSFVLATITVAIWIYMTIGHGRFWRVKTPLDSEPSGPVPKQWPSVIAVIPARNEAPLLRQSLASILSQDYNGRLDVIVVNDHSTDDTPALIRRLVERYPRVRGVDATTLPNGWSGKLWALNCGLQAAPSTPDYWLFTDADIHHQPTTLRNLVVKAKSGPYDLVSIMALLGGQNRLERWLNALFVFFFQMIYPFAWVNTPGRRTAAAAGGCILVKNNTLALIGSVTSVRDQIIDDCALAAKFKQRGASIFLSLSRHVHSLRPLNGWPGMWRTVERTAYAQLFYQPYYVVLTLVGLVLVYLYPVIVVLSDDSAWPLGVISWLLMAGLFIPTAQLYNLNPIWGMMLPFGALVFSSMTVSSCLKYHFGRGSHWKSRHYPPKHTHGRL